MTDPAQAIYAANAAAMAAKYEAISASDHFAPVADLLPAPSARVADIGAGSGRDAVWLAGQGHRVTAAEPVAELRAEALRRHPGAAVRWVADGLPDLTELGRFAPFDLVTLSAVWHHLQPRLRVLAMAGLSGLLAPGGRLILSLRHGPEMPDLGVHAPDVEGTLAMADRQGLTLTRRVQAKADEQSNRDAGILWTWLALSRGG